MANQFIFGLTILCATIFVYLMYPGVEFIVLSYAGVFFWTGFLEYGIQTTDDPETKASLYTMLEQWEKRVEIDKKYDFFSTRLNATSGMISDATIVDIDHDFLYFMDGIAAMSNNGEPETAISFLERYDPATETQKDEIQRHIELMRHQQEMIDNQREYIKLATDLLQDYQFSPNIQNPHIYFCYLTYFQIGQIALLGYTYLMAKRRNRSRPLITLFQIIAFMFTTGLHANNFSTTHLDRVLYEVPFRHFLSSLVFTNMEMAHRPSETLERARQLFLKYPLVYEDLCSHQAMSLMYQVILREVSRCNNPLVGSKENEHYDDIEPCESAHRVIHTFAEMMDADRSMEYAENLDFWYEFVDFAFGVQVTPHVDPSVVNQASYMEKSDRLRAVADDWLKNIMADSVNKAGHEKPEYGNKADYEKHEIDYENDRSEL